MKTREVIESNPARGAYAPRVCWPAPCEEAEGNGGGWWTGEPPASGLQRVAGGTSSTGLRSSTGIRRGRRIQHAGARALPGPLHGSALLVVLWALLVLSVAVFAWARWIQQDLQISSNANRGAEALAMAHSGVAVALHPAVTKQTPILQEELGTNLGYRVRIISEGGKLNLAWLLQGEDPRKLAMLKTWLAMRGLKFREIDTLVDCLLDYIDPDNLHRLNGVEDDGDYHAANRPLLSLDEVTQVRGSDPLEKAPGWKDQLTLVSSGPLDLLAAPAELLRLVPGLGEARIQRLLTYRAGRDGIDGTADDPEIQGLPQVYSLLGLSQAEQTQLNGLFMANDPTVRIIAEGHSGKVVRQVEVVARKSGGYPQILSWKE